MNQTIIAEGVPITDGRTVVEVTFEPGKTFTVAENITPLMLATIHNQKEILRFLLHNGADVNIRTNSGNTALHYASFMGYDEIVRMLTHHGANVNASNAFGQTPLLVCSGKVLKYWAM